MSLFDIKNYAHSAVKEERRKNGIHTNYNSGAI